MVDEDLPEDVWEATEARCREQAVQPEVPVVQERAHAAAHSKHARCGRSKSQGVHVRPAKPPIHSLPV